jgi:hypothetical protein
MSTPVAPTVSTSIEASHLIKASSGSVYGAYVLNLTSLQGFFLLIDANAIPPDGPVTPKAVIPLPASGFATITGADNAPMVFANGIVVALTSALDPFTLTTSGGLQGFISCQAQ